jgi:hypothetical protein
VLVPFPFIMRKPPKRYKPPADSVGH